MTAGAPRSAARRALRTAGLLALVLVALVAWPVLIVLLRARIGAVED